MHRCNYAHLISINTLIYHTLDFTVHPCAKINLGLYVTERRHDGYHNIQTVFYPIPLCDVLSISEDDEDEFMQSGIPVACTPNENLVMRALAQLRRDFDIPKVKINLQKNIPSGAGLGGGSSDAAHTIKLLNKMFHLGMNDEEMERRATLLGADCAFFIKERPTLAEGIGNEFTPIDLDLKGWYLVLVKPSEFVSTREAYAMIKPRQPQHSIMSTITQPVQAWKGMLLNDFENSVFPGHPAIEEIKKNLYRIGATYACMSGSGSSVFGLFRQKPADIDEIFHPHFIYTAQL